MNEADLSSHKLPPQNIEAEQSVLGGILIENEAIHRVMEILTPDDFYRDAHRKIFKSLARPCPNGMNPPISSR